MIIVAVKIFALAFTLLVILKSYLAYRQRQESLVMFLFWSLTWLAILVVAFYPDIVTTILGSQRLGVGTLLGIAVVFVYFIVYRIYVKAHRIEKMLNDIIRQLALNDLEKPKK